MMGVTPSRVILSEAEKATDLWRRIREHFTRKLEAARRMNDAVMPEEKRLPLLIDIAAANQILDLEKHPPGI
jgi:hypothetical protein